MNIKTKLSLYTKLTIHEMLVINEYKRSFISTILDREVEILVFESMMKFSILLRI